MAPTGLRVHVWCKACRHSVDAADLDALIRIGKGDIPLVRLKWQCAPEPATDPATESAPARAPLALVSCALRLFERLDAKRRMTCSINCHYGCTTMPMW